MENNKKEKKKRKEKRREEKRREEGKARPKKERTENQKPSGVLGRRHAKIQTEFMEEDGIERRAVAGVDPVASGRVGLFRLALSLDDVVVARRAGDGG